MMGDQPFTVVVLQVLVVGQVQDHGSLCVVESRKATWGNVARHLARMFLCASEGHVAVISS